MIGREKERERVRLCLEHLISATVCFDLIAQIFQQLLTSHLQAYTFLSYIVGLGPPGYIFNLIGAGHTLLNMLKVCD